MATTLDNGRFELPDITDWYAGDSRILAFTVERDGTLIDLTNATITWGLWEKAYQEEEADAILTGDSAGVEIVTDSRVDAENGEFEVRLDPEATEDIYGEFWHRPQVTQGGTTASWRGRVLLES